MYKTAVPISVRSLRDDFLEEDLNTYLEFFKKGKIERVFICCLGPVWTNQAEQKLKSYKFKRAVEFFRENDLEVGVWIGGFGHGSSLSHDTSISNKHEYQKIVGIMGESYEHGYCPLDENLTRDYLESVRLIAEYSPDIIMIDDDFRLNGRNYYFGCFCDKHLKEFYRIVGEEVPREKIEKLMFTGGKNKYRDAYMEMSKNTLLDFAKKVRGTVNSINPNIRVGACMVFPTWDFEGTDGIEIAKAFAGSTKPFMRGIGAPYHNQTVMAAVENQRLQAHWTDIYGDDIEFFNEGDVYPRPRYFVPSKSLELFDLALCCTGETDGILKYMFHYSQNVGYETGYVERHIKNIELKEKISALFKNKKMTGVRVYSAMHKMENYVFPEEYEPGFVRKLETLFRPCSSYILSKNSIPTCYTESEYPVAVFGESARYIDADCLKNGAVIDSRAAKILAERGIDTGIISIKSAENVEGEYFAEFGDTVSGIGDCRISEMKCKDNVKICSEILPQKSPGMYLYENGDGIRFMVLAADLEFDMPQFAFEANLNYYSNYYRQDRIIKGIEYLCGKKLPAVCEKNPNLYMLAGRNEKSTSVLMLNIFADDIPEPIIALDKEYKSAAFVNCTGELRGDKLYLSDIHAYGAAAFELFE